MTSLSYKPYTSPDGIEIVIENNTGAAYFTINGYARMSGLTKQAISKRYKGVNQNEKKVAEVNTPGGLQGVNLISAKLAFKWAIKDNSDLAERMGECGATVFAYQLAGINVKAETRDPEQAPRQLPPVRDVIDYIEADKYIKAIENPIIKAAFEQRLAEELGATHVFPPTRESNPVLASVLARELGFTLSPGDDAKLGKWVRKYHEPIGKCQHGRYKVNVYSREEIEDTVIAFFR